MFTSLGICFVVKKTNSGGLGPKLTSLHVKVIKPFVIFKRSPLQIPGPTLLTWGSAPPPPTAASPPPPLKKNSDKMTAGRGVVRKSLGSNKEILKLKKGFTGLWLQEDSMSKTLLCVDRIFKGRGSSVHCSKYSLTFLSLNNLNLFKLLSTQI